MTKWFHKITLPLATIWLFLFAFVLASEFSANDSFEKVGALFAQFAFPLALTGWLLSDAQKRGKKLCYDYDSFAFWAWPIILPVYLFQTRGWRAIITLLWFAGICAAATLFGLVLSLLRE
jgi:hypothetical protein